MTPNVSGLPLATQTRRIHLDQASSDMGIPTLSSCSPDAFPSLLAHAPRRNASQDSEPEATVAATEPALAPLNAAIRGLQVDAARRLLQDGADAGHADHVGRTALFDAVATRDPEMLRLLLDHQAETERLLPASLQRINRQDKEGNTALHLAALQGQAAAVNALVCAGAEVAQRNARQNTPLALAARAGHVEATALLLRSDRDLERAARNGQHALKHAAHMRQLEVVELLLQHGVAVDGGTMQLTQDGMVYELLRRAPMLRQGGDPIGAAPRIDFGTLVTTLVDAAARHKHAGSWDQRFKKLDICDGLTLAVRTAASDLAAVWASLAGSQRKMTAAQQRNWCAGILANLDNAMLADPPYAGKGLSGASEALFNRLAEKQARALSQAGVDAEQPMREGMHDLLGTCMQAVSGDKFDPLALYQLLADRHGIYHTVASLIAAAFADVWPRRRDLAGLTLAHAFAVELSDPGRKQNLVMAISSSAAVTNKEALLMLIHRQVALLAGWCDRSLRL